MLIKSVDDECGTFCFGAAYEGGRFLDTSAQYPRDRINEKDILGWSYYPYDGDDA